MQWPDLLLFAAACACAWWRMATRLPRSSRPRKSAANVPVAPAIFERMTHVPENSYVELYTQDDRCLRLLQKQLQRSDALTILHIYPAVNSGAFKLTPEGVITQ